MKAATAETWKAMHPTRLSPAAHQATSRRSTRHQPWHTSNQARRLETRKNTEPTMSGAHTSRYCCWVVRSEASAANVVTLNASVPTSCTAVAHQSMRWGCHANQRRRPGSVEAASDSEMACTYCR